MKTERRILRPLEWQKPKSRWRKLMETAIPLPHVLGYTALILAPILVFLGLGYSFGHQTVNGPELEEYKTVMKGYRYAAGAVVENCILDRRQRAQLHSGGRIENVLERR